MERAHSRFFETLAADPRPLGDVTKGETQIISDPAEVARIEAVLTDRYGAKGHPEFGRVGVLAETPWFVFLQEPALFPSRVPGGEPIIGSHARVLYRGDAAGNRSLCLLPILEDGRILLNKAYRSPVRRWTLEGPGRITKDGESHQDAVKRCVSEETGRPLRDLVLLSPGGGTLPDRGLIGALVPIYLAILGDPYTEITDATVDSNRALTLDELAEAFTRGSFDEDGRSYLCADSYTAFALLLAHLQGYLRLPSRRAR